MGAALKEEMYTISQESGVLWTSEKVDTPKTLAKISRTVSTLGSWIETQKLDDSKREGH